MEELYSDPVPQAEERELSSEEQQLVQDMLSVEALKAQAGWPVLIKHLEAQRAVLLDKLTYEANPTEISRLQGAVHALNLFFGTTEALFHEGAFYRRIQRPRSEAPGQP